MKKRFFSFMRFFRKDCLCHLILLSVLIGIIVGLISVVFHFSLSFLDNNIFRGITGFVETTSQRVKFDSERIIDFGVYRPWLLPVVIGLGALIAGIIVANFAPDTRGHGTDQALKAYHHKNGIIAPKVPVIKTIASVITLGFGGSGGAEGPMVQSGAGVGSFIARLLKLSVRERRILLISGMAAGLGSFFKAPIAGAIFSNEILYRDGNFEDDALVPATIASVIGYITYSFFYGFSPLFQTEQTMFIMYWHYLIPLTILALVCSAFGSFFVKTFYKIHDIFEKLSLPLWLKPAIGGVLTGLLAIFIPYVAGSSYGYLQGVFVNELSLTILILLAFGKVIATSFSIGSGGSGGVFGPSMVIGGALGGAVGIIYNMAANGQYAVNPGTMGILGMAGFFTAVANTPISTLIMVSEMTGD
ncbi:MAG: chloride channel protein, partial [Candidatus Muiribacteriota bacterium]